ncbi:MAG: Hsp20/alpha crystallin family protein [Methylococcaceae bacterium]|nr:Hsp20/alpha crystallin family protein [Methylococcaceae bacterium]
MAKKDDKVTTPSKEIQAAPPRQAFPAHLDEIDQWFEEFFPRAWMQPFFRRAWPEMEAAFGGKFPKVDVIDRDNEVVVHAELPGVNKDDLDVSLSDNLLTIRARTHHEAREEKGQYHRREISRGEFQRTLRLPANVEGDKTTASFKDGILELVAPKTAGSKRQSIKID